MKNIAIRENHLYKKTYLSGAKAGGRYTSIYVLKDKKVTVNSDVTSEQMEALEVAGATQPTLNFKAYAIQKDNIDDVNDAWTKINTPDA